MCVGVARAREARAYCHPAVGGAPLTACGCCGVAAAAAAAAYAYVATGGVYPTGTAGGWGGTVVGCTTGGTT